MAHQEPATHASRGARSVMRHAQCVRARRTCPGYKPSKDRKLINYIGDADCSLLRQVPAVFLRQSEDGISDWDNIDQEARQAFFDDYCIISRSRSLSRGYLHGLQAMIAKVGPRSELTRACTIMALASRGKKLHVATYLNRAKDLYSVSLRSFRLSISNEATFTSGESLITAALLGLYEVITASDAYHGAHVAHAQGISAILLSKLSPFELVCNGKLFQVADPTPLEDLDGAESESPALQHSLTIPGKRSQKFSILCTPIFSRSKSKATIDTIYAQTEPLIRKAEFVLGRDANLDEVRHLLLEAEQMKETYYSWPETTPEEWKPRSAGVIAPQNYGSTPDVGYWPGNVTSYYDLYVASIWNNYRKACLLVLNIIISCHRRINNPDSLEIAARVYLDVTSLTEEVVSSIPYLLAVDLQSFVENGTAGTPPIVPGRPVGGLLSMHTLYVLATLPIAETKLKLYTKKCLAWIGDEMGIGQAAILSKCTTMDQLDYATESRVIIWAGMLI
ncbi:hypothetical protein V1527DRAFT_454858 [Lipomyces starkeyi]